MLSVMTVVLPQHSKHAATSTVTSTTVASTISNSKTLSRSYVAPPRYQNCDCRCGIEGMTKNSLPQRCPFLKGFNGDQRRPHILDNFSNTPPPSTSREWETLREAACFWKDKYERLYENQRRLQKINESLEEKLLQIAEKFENEKCDLTRDVSDLTSRLVEARLSIAELEEENEQYRNDCNIAVRLLQCKPSSFVAHRFNSLPADFQEKVKRHLRRPQKEIRPPSISSSLLLDKYPSDVRTIKVSVPTLPPAAMVYSVDESSAQTSSNHQPNPTSSSNEEATPDHVSAAIIAKVLEERSLERKKTASYKKQQVVAELHRNKETENKHVATQTDCPRQMIVPYCSRCHISPKFRPITNNFHRNIELDSAKMLKEKALSSSTETAI